MHNVGANIWICLVYQFITSVIAYKLRQIYLNKLERGKCITYHCTEFWKRFGWAYGNQWCKFGAVLGLPTRTRKRNSANATPQTQLRKRNFANATPQTQLRKRNSANATPQSQLRKRNSANATPHTPHTLYYQFILEAPYNRRVFFWKTEVFHRHSVYFYFLFDLDPGHWLSVYEGEMRLTSGDNSSLQFSSNLPDLSSPEALNLSKSFCTQVRCSWKSLWRPYAWENDFETTAVTGSGLP